MTSTPDAPSLLDIYLALSHIDTPRTQEVQASASPASSASPLAPLPGEEPEDAPRLYVARLADGGWHVVIHPDLPAATRAALAAQPPQALFSDYQRVNALLEQGEATAALDAHGLGAGVWIGRTLLFPDDLTPALAQRTLTNVARLGPGVGAFGGPAPRAALRLALAPADEPSPPRTAFPREQFVVLADGVIASICVSARESELAAEAWARTLPTASRRGYATRATAAWALDVRRRGKIPFYSYARDNMASAGVARALGLIPFLDDVGYL